LVARPDNIPKPWEKGWPGKFLIDGGGNFHHWRTDPNEFPHHADAARHLGIQSVIDGMIEPDGTAWMTARDPSTDHQALMTLAIPQAEAAGIRLDAAPDGSRP
jgi:hypothetical protein